MAKIAVIGGGTMGLDVAHCFARSGFETYVLSTSQTSIENHKAKLTASLDKLEAKGKIDAEMKAETMSNLHFTTEIQEVSDAGLILEAVPENEDIKKELFARLDELCPPDTIFASNTSTIPITKLASCVKRSDKVVGMHFFNPATVMKLVEVIRAEQTSQETFDAVFELAKAMGKEPVEVKDSPGFVVNKILIPMINEAADLVYAGVASPEDVDKAMQLGAAHPMGPLALGDLIGLDVCLAIMDTLYSETQNAKYEASPLLKQMVSEGKLGRKTGQGFFKY